MNETSTQIRGTQEVKTEILSLQELMVLLDRLQEVTSIIGDARAAQLLQAGKDMHPSELAHHILTQLTPEEIAQLGKELKLYDQN